MSKAISVSTGPIFTIFFHQKEGIWWIFLIRSSFSDSSRDVAMATNFVAKLAKWPSFSTLAFLNWLKYRNMDNQLYSINDPSASSTSCTNMVKFGSVTPEIYHWSGTKFVLLKRYCKNLTKYLNNYWTDFHQRFRFGRGMYEDYKTDISFALVLW